MRIMLIDVVKLKQQVSKIKDHDLVMGAATGCMQCQADRSKVYDLSKVDIDNIYHAIALLAECRQLKKDSQELKTLKSSLDALKGVLK